MTDYELPDDRIEKDVVDYYASGVEDQRLQQGIGKLEFLRTKEIISRDLPPPPAVIYDVGGGPGMYSLWLAKKGYQVHLLDVSPDHIAKARMASEDQLDNPIFSIEAADARHLDCPDSSADVVMLMGPLYHLIEREERICALEEAYRVLKTNGLLFAAGITRYGNALYGLVTYGLSNRILDEPEFMEMTLRELEDGNHFRPDIYPDFIPRSYFHLPGGLRGEIEEAGFFFERMLAVEGPGWIVPNFDEMWSDESRRERVLKIVRAVEDHSDIMGMSPHLLAIARKGNLD